MNAEERCSIYPEKVGVEHFHTSSFCGSLFQDSHPPAIANGVALVLLLSFVSPSIAGKIGGTVLADRRFRMGTHKGLLIQVTFFDRPLPQ